MGTTDRVLTDRVLTDRVLTDRVLTDVCFGVGVTVVWVLLCTPHGTVCLTHAYSWPTTGYMYQPMRLSSLGGQR